MTDGEWAIGEGAARQTWIADGGGFVRVQLADGRDRVLGKDDVDALAPRHCANPDCTHLRKLVPDCFLYCTECGHPTEEVLRAGAEPWPPAMGFADSVGFPATDLQPQPTAMRGQPAWRISEWDMPQDGNFHLMVAGPTGRLVALNHTNGSLFLRSETASGKESWVRGKEMVLRNCLDMRCFAAAADADGITFPAWGGFARLRLPRQAAPSLTLPAADDGRPLGGVGAVEGFHLMPAARNKMLVLLCRRRDDGALSRVEVAGALPDTADLLLGRPVPTPDGSLFWCARAGYLFVDVAGAGPPVARWHAWQDGFRALPLSGPFIDTAGDIWQIGRLDDGGVRFHKVTPAAPARGLQAAMYHFVSAGVRTYNESVGHRVPWTPPVMSWQLPLGNSANGQFSLPLLLCGGGGLVYADIADRRVMRDFLETGIDKPVQAVLSFARGGTGPAIPGIPAVQMCRPDDLRVCVSGERIIFYARDANKAWCWQPAG